MLDDFNRGYELGSLLTNTDIKNKYTYKAAIKLHKEEFGDLDIYIEDEAFDSKGRQIRHCISIHTNSRGTDHSQFWDIYNKLKGK